MQTGEAPTSHGGCPPTPKLATTPTCSLTPLLLLSTPSWVCAFLSSSCFRTQLLSPCIASRFRGSDGGLQTLKLFRIRGLEQFLNVHSAIKLLSYDSLGKDKMPAAFLRTVDIVLPHVMGIDVGMGLTPAASLPSAVLRPACRTLCCVVSLPSRMKRHAST